jgi:hypothetical protein
MNVMCGKTEIESMKHQLSALGVLRPKIAAIRKEMVDPEAPAVEVEAEAVADGVVKTEEIADEDPDESEELEE